MQKFPQDYAKISFEVILMTHIQDCGKQLQKLPHEMVDPNLDRPVGQTYLDVVTSYSNMIDHLEGMLKPYHDPKYIESLKDAPDNNNAREIFLHAKERFGHLIDLCERKGFLLQKIIALADAEGS
jgi:hypothetical protein